MKIKNYITCLIKKLISLTKFFQKDKSTSIKLKELLLKKHLKLTFGDQKGQVDFLINNVLNYEKNGLFKNGFFIDLACADGITINNTYFLEKYLNWKGLLFEPNPYYKSKIEQSRKAKLITDCVSDKEDEVLSFRIDNGMLGGIVSQDMDNNMITRGDQLKNAKIIKVKTTTLFNELEKINAPKLIDFLSLDVEGAEWLILKNFPFDKYKFRCMTIERPNHMLDILLEKNDYRQVAHLMYDVIYVHKDFLDEVNFDPYIKFAFTPRKNW